MVHFQAAYVDFDTSGQSDGANDDVFVRKAVDLGLGERPATQVLVDERVILGELPQDAASAVVDSTVPHVGVVQGIAAQPCDNQCRAHTAEGDITSGGGHHAAIGQSNSVHEGVARVAAHAEPAQQGPDAPGLRPLTVEVVPQGVHGKPAGHIAGQVTPHAVGHGHQRQGRQHEVGVFLPLAHQTGVGLDPDVQVERLHSDDRWGAGALASPTGRDGRRMTQVDWPGSAGLESSGRRTAIVCGVGPRGKVTVKVLPLPAWEKTRTEPPIR